MTDLFGVLADSETIEFTDLVTPWLPTASSGTGIVVTVTGKYSITGFASGMLSTQEEINDLHMHWSSAISQQLGVGGAKVVVTAMTDESVEYEVEVLLDISSDPNALVDQIENELSDLSALSAKVVSESSSSSYPWVAFSVAPLSIESHTAGPRTISSLLKWYPDWRDGSNACQNNGMQPAFMDDNPDDYLFDSELECCQTWFSYGPCAKSSLLSGPKFLPDWAANVCVQKSDIETWELDDVYDSLDECCSQRFAYNKQECCSAPGMGGCSGEGAGSGSEPVVYLPDWSASKCDSKSESTLASYEGIYSFPTIDDCCKTQFGWDRTGCCKRSGGC